MLDIKLRLMGHRTGTSLLKLLPLACLLAACGANYSPNTYSSSAVQQASKVDSGVVVGVRKVTISADAALASTTGAAAGGIAGSQVATGAVSALGALGGAVAGGLTGNKIGHNVQDTFGYEYIVRKANGDLLSVTQKDAKPLEVGQHVLLIQGSQARIVSDYTVPVDTDLAQPAKPPSANRQKPDLSKAAADASTASDAATPVATPSATAAAAPAAATTDDPATAAETSAAPGGGEAASKADAVPSATHGPGSAH